MPCFRWEVSNTAIYSSRTLISSVSLNKIDICGQLSLKRNNLCFNLCYKGISLWLCFQGLVIASIKAPSGLEFLCRALFNQSGLYFYGNVYKVYDMVVSFVIYRLSSQHLHFIKPLIISTSFRLNLFKYKRLHWISTPITNFFFFSNICIYGGAL